MGELRRVDDGSLGRVCSPEIVKEDVDARRLEKLAGVKVRWDTATYIA